jgi:heterotetrameric sarcosine oxidase delta subunit
MHRITCPHCGLRDEAEFRFRGDATVTRPGDNGGIAEYDEYLHMRANTKGWAIEWWHHTLGCRHYLKVVRHTVTHEIRATALPTAVLTLPTDPGLSNEARSR